MAHRLSDCFPPRDVYDFDSFNVEDLRDVDNSVIANLFPLPTNSTQSHSPRERLRSSQTHQLPGPLFIPMMTSSRQP
jgi:hypothetical protein